MILKLRNWNRDHGINIGIDQPSNRIYLNKVSVFSISDRDYGMHFFYKFLFFIVVKVHVPFCQSCLSSTILDKDKTNLGLWLNLNFKNFEYV